MKSYKMHGINAVLKIEIDESDFVIVARDSSGARKAFEIPHTDTQTVGSVEISKDSAMGFDGFSSQVFPVVFEFYTDVEVYIGTEAIKYLIDQDSDFENEFAENVRRSGCSWETLFDDSFFENVTEMFRLSYDDSHPDYLKDGVSAFVAGHFVDRWRLNETNKKKSSV